MPTNKLKLPSYGGQALIEGVLMRGSHYLAAAMRSPQGEIIVEKEELHGIYMSPLAKIPFLRGIVILWDALGLGTKYLTKSANVQTGEEEKIEGPALYGTLFISFAIAIAIFFLAPAAIAHALQTPLHLSVFWGNMVEGLIRLVLIILYIWAVGRMPDIRRVFSYHGAEHKTINAFEAGAELTPESVQKYSLHHPRCGTGFILILVVFSIIVFALLGPLSLVWRLITRIILIPVIAMVAYEYMRFIANHLDLAFFRWLSKPNMAMQRLTTVEPSLDMIEVAITAFKTMYEEETRQKTES
jgi:uncharacterized protein YqhQ